MSHKSKHFFWINLRIFNVKSDFRLSENPEFRANFEAIAAHCVGKYCQISRKTLIIQYSHHAGKCRIARNGLHIAHQDVGVFNRRYTWLNASGELPYEVSLNRLKRSHPEIQYASEIAPAAAISFEEINILVNLFRSGRRGDCNPVDYALSKTSLAIDKLVELTEEFMIANSQRRNYLSSCSTKAGRKKRKRKPEADASTKMDAKKQDQKKKLKDKKPSYTAEDIAAAEAIRTEPLTTKDYLVLCPFLKVYCDPGQLVLVLNTNADEEEYFIEELRQQKISALPKVVNNEVPVNSRYSLYLQGGVLFVSSRILVVDLLSDRVPVSHITGILINRAHKLTESSQEAFILRLYRQRNHEGFIKGFTDHPHAFQQGFGRVERIMKNLFVRKLFLWPRFEASVVDTFNAAKPEVIEMQLKLSPRMRDVQMAIMDLIAACVKEVKRCNPTVNTDDITVESAISRAFEKLVALYLDPVWHQLSAKTKQLIADLKVFRTLLLYLTSYDCLSFYILLLRLRNRASPTANVSSWLFLEPAEKLFILSQERVFGEARESAEINMDVLEMNPKWKAIQEIAAEIKTQNEQLGDSELGPGRTLVFAADEMCCSQLKTLLQNGHQMVINRIVEHSDLAGKITVKQKSAKAAVSMDAQKKRKAHAKKDQMTLTQMGSSKRQKSEDPEVEIVEDHPALDAGAQWDLKSEILLWTDVVEYETLSPSATVLHPLYTFSERAFEVVRVLRRFMPRYIVLYDMDMNVVRQIEVHKATRPELPLRVYFVMYTGSVEEQRYLTTLRVEKQAFEYLIREKGTMALPEDITADLYRDVAFAEQLNTRKGGMIDPKQFDPPRVIVDMREFRSELPSLIHRRGIDILPVTLEVGDYILTPDICVERKSVNDLIGSLNSGRLYSQATQMTRFYKKPVLLIEFDQNKSFSLRGNYAKDTTLKEVSNKLVVLTLHFPKLRILWCSSPYATAELFQELKLGRPEPDPTKAATVTAVDDATTSEERFSQAAKELLLKLPGVNHRNCLTIMHRVESIAALCKLEEKDLAAAMGNPADARTLYKFIHTDYESNAEEAAKNDANAKPKTKYRFGKKVS
ncbi:DNA repair endonuclease XPF [Hypsibius exemplaris]|uniref:DNA repair endonuclease XPF n=1 Tax=Hypsibius exemplaris TaxID=2072580 RepID=A0A1W0WCM8_HYPEX|nr:DNA repair endonuclease XPF [Hypsibius exemplaris]